MRRCLRVLQEWLNVGLRDMIGRLGVAAAQRYRSQDLRRGHYEDMRTQGKRLFEILAAAGVRSPKAPRPYMDRAQVELEAVMETQLGDDSEEEGS